MGCAEQVKPFQELVLVNYCHPDCAPLRNIMRLPKDEAFSLARSLAAAHPNTTAFYRFADFENYYALRTRQDAYLHAQFLEQGGLQALLDAAGKHYVEAQLWSDRYTQSI